MKYYAGIGSRETPFDILEHMTQIAIYLGHQKYCLRSGGASGADTAFEIGAPTSEIFLASHATDEAIACAQLHHPAWNRCSDYARKLHGRNSMILLGKELNQPVEFVICWTRNGQPTGGTGLGIRIALAHKIPVFNLFYPDILNRLITAYQS